MDANINRHKILEIVKQHPGMSAEEISAISANVGGSATKVELDELVASGAIIRHNGKHHVSRTGKIDHLEGVEAPPALDSVPAEGEQTEGEQTEGIHEDERHDHTEENQS